MLVDLFSSKPYTVEFEESRAIFRLKKLETKELPIEDIKCKAMYLNMTAKKVGKNRGQVGEEETFEYAMILPCLSDVK